MSDVGEWLERQKLSQYAEMFDASDIDFDVLVDLTEDDLRELSVSFGHRQRLLKAIVQLRAERAASAAASTTGPSPIAAAQTAMPAGERRLITVLFCDLVGSTAMTAAADDPEDMFELIAEYHAACSEVIERFGGYVARLVGDGVLAYFGNPRALEGEAERAVRAALAQRDAVQAMGEKRRLKLAVRIGIDTGMVIIGDLVYHGNAEEDTAVGDTPNLAARLQGMAEPGQIVFSQNTRRLVGTLFELSDMGVHTLKGFAVAMHVYRVEAEAEGASRFSIRASLTTASLIGREAECALLGYLWRTAVTGKGQVVLVSGEPGIGKSHLLHNLRDSVADAAPALLLYECSPFYANSAFQVLATHMARTAGIQRSDTPDERLAKLETLVIPGVDPREALPLMGFLCGVPTDHRYPRLDLPPEQRKRAVLSMFNRQLDALCAAGPVLMLVEDAHWIDPSSSELLAHTISRISELPLLIVISHRTGEEPDWLKEVDGTRMQLQRLDQAGAEAVISQVAGGPLPPALQAQILEKSNGVPLFVEEITK